MEGQNIDGKDLPKESTQLGFRISELHKEKARRRHAEEALRACEEKYRDPVANANSIILRMDTGGNVIFLNEFAQSFFGYREDEILGKNVVGTIVPEIETTGRDLAGMIKEIGEHPDRFDLVITDMTMPKMTGEDLAREILMVRPDIPIILCTGFSDRISPEKAEAMGIREFIMKPVISRDLAEAVRRALGATTREDDK